MYFTDRNQHAIPLFIKANTMPPSFLYYQSVSNLMHDIHSKSAPRNIQNLFKTTNDIHAYNTRSSKSLKFLYQSSRLEIQKNAFSRIGVKLWNEIPLFLREKPKRIFKKELEMILIDIFKEGDSYIELSTIISKVKLFK